MRRSTKCISALLATALLSGGSVFAQNKSDSTAVKESDRNVMLNAANNTGPREVNIGLPASVGGTTILENGLPVVYFFWPELPTKAWRSDATLNKVQLLDLGQTAIKIGDVGFSLSTYDNLGTDDYHGTVGFNSNHFGLLNGSMNLSGPVTKNGLKFSAGAYLNLDPGSFNPAGYNKYYSDKTQLYKTALTQDYAIDGLKGSISVLYKYAKVQGLRQQYAPFILKAGGKVKELDGFKMGTDSYYERSGKITLQDAFTGELVERDPLKDYGSESHTVDLIWKNQLSNGLNIDLISRYHTAKTGNYLPIMTGIDESSAGGFVYEDGSAYTGSHVQNVMALASKRTPIKSFMTTLEIGRQSGNHTWSVGLNQWNYSIDRYATEGTFYTQEVAKNPRKLLRLDATGVPTKPAYTYEYHNGSENKAALFFTDKWKVNDVLDLSAGARIEYQTLNGDYQDKNKIGDEVAAGRPALAGSKESINEHWWNKAFMLNAVYKMTSSFGLLGEFSYNEQGGHLENYNIGVNPGIKKSVIPEAGFGVFFNHPMISVVSKGTFIKRNENRTTTNFSNTFEKVNPATGVKETETVVNREMTGYGVQTLGWTTDIVAKPFKGFDLHLLVTIQSPKYKEFSGDVVFDNPLTPGTTETKPYNFNDKSVTGVSKVLIEIDPSYTWNNLRVWASARYFSKQYMNKPNTLYFAGRWETFAGANYSINKHFDVNVTFVNLLNQRGASGSVPDGDLLLDQADADAKLANGGAIMSGTYLRPFTAEFGKI